MSVPASIARLPERADELRDLLTRWCNQNSGSENLPGLAAMLNLLQAEFTGLPGARLERVALQGTTAQALRLKVRPAAAFPQRAL